MEREVLAILFKHSASPGIISLVSVMLSNATLSEIYGKLTTSAKQGANTLRKKTLLDLLSLPVEIQVHVFDLAVQPPLKSARRPHTWSVRAPKHSKMLDETGMVVNIRKWRQSYDPDTEFARIATNIMNGFYGFVTTDFQFEAYCLEIESDLV